MSKSLSTLLRNKTDILELQNKPDGSGYEWRTARTVWAGIEEDRRKNIFSDIGIGARGVTLTIRPLAHFSLFNAIRWGNQHLFLTSIIPSANRDRLEIKAARCTICDCQSDMDKEKRGPSFPGIMTEKYAGHEQMDPLAVVTKVMVLVTPKVITLASGSWVSCNGSIYQVLVPHELDEWKNEYEIRRQEDC